ncbi:hypothetical protein CEXT_337011 [Caerostris extrusa]|uniref:Uncharacterized protein n=1 Tax=Caerostris extrusa TaxID=172846 RepID=A0AAV4XUB4_CAEEX|nr:hypothetical protein CEXT_337011 [Caerostris extrusa]
MDVTIHIASTYTCSTNAYKFQSIESVSCSQHLEKQTSSLSPFPSPECRKAQTRRAEDVSSGSLPLIMNGSRRIRLGAPQSDLMVLPDHSPGRRRDKPPFPLFSSPECLKAQTERTEDVSTGNLPSTMNGSQADSSRHTSKQPNGPFLITPRPRRRGENIPLREGRLRFEKFDSAVLLIKEQTSFELQTCASRGGNHKRERTEHVSSRTLPSIINGFSADSPRHTSKQPNGPSLITPRRRRGENIPLSEVLSVEKLGVALAALLLIKEQACVLPEGGTSRRNCLNYFEILTTLWPVINHPEGEVSVLWLIRLTMSLGLRQRRQTVL